MTPGQFADTEQNALSFLFINVFHKKELIPLLFNSISTVSGKVNALLALISLNVGIYAISQKDVHQRESHQKKVAG